MFIKLLIITQFISINHIYSALRRIPDLKTHHPIFDVIKRYSHKDNHKKTTAHAEELADIKHATKTLFDGLITAGFNPDSFDIMVVNRLDQRQNICAKRCCPYPKHVLDPHATSVFFDDPEAACLCTRYSRFDTINYFIQAKKREPELK